MQAANIQPIRRDDVHLRELDGEAIVYDKRHGTVHHFNKLALFVWNSLDGTKTPGQIADQATEAKGIDAVTALTAVARVLRQFADWHLIEPSAPLSEADCHESRTQTTTEKDVIDSAHPPETQEMRATMGMDSDVTSDAPNYSRRELFAGGASKLLFVPPLVSSFIAVGAYASGPSFSAAFGNDGDMCKTPGYSYAVPGDCCNGPVDASCDGGACCIKNNSPGCEEDADCCGAPGWTCNAGTCE